MQNDREKIRKLVLKNYLGHESYKLVDLPIDCSFRTYHRVENSDKKMLLMDCPPDKEDIKPFIKVSRLLESFDLPVPQIYYFDEKKGVALIEDFGDDLMKIVLDQYPEKRETLYKDTIDLLADFHSKEHTNIPLENYDLKELMREVMLFIEWYLPKTLNQKLSSELVSEFESVWVKLIDKLYYKSSTLVLRDYHAENIMIVNSNSQKESLGIIDYQDAVIGSYAYDLVSLLEDARTEVEKPFREKMISYYLNHYQDIDPNKFMSDYVILGAQRNLKIIGVFARKDSRDKNSKYLRFIPRMWRYISDNIDNPLLQDLKDWFRKAGLDYEKLSKNY